MKAFNLLRHSVPKLRGTLFYRSVPEVRPPVLSPTSDPPAVFDGTTRLYMSYTCPFAHRAWITRNVKGLKETIKLVPIDLNNKPAWYKEKVYPDNKVPALEHNGKVIGESIDLVKYIDKNFDGPALLPVDPEKQEFTEELIQYSDTFMKAVYTAWKGADPITEAGSAFDHLETALQKFADGPFFLGESISVADIVYAPFIERFRGYFGNELKYEITSGRPNLAAWVEAMEKIDAYTETKCDIDVFIQLINAHVLGKK
ncbi:OLC1v1034690C1 [Oldenlandia corymbosa var. corymbosa]|uniref:OLC1v1034690C1 n=1 Tax=Oldenlandia corymbosa var. corymbosa TaxID=529605 RepID=A0AAV1CRU2_OLDCO|nr:OLC1v1034690C1 [Oldenlandia corymbosa var. corymbosa]